MTIETGESQTNGEGGAASTTGADEYDAAFAEFASTDTDAPGDLPAAGAEEGKDPDDGGEARPGADAAAGQSEEAAAGAPASGGGDDDPLAGLPEEHRERVKGVLDQRDQQYRSALGRLSAADRELAKLRSSGAGQPQGGGEGQGQGKQSPELKALLEGDEVKRFRDEYGTEFGPVLNLIDGLVAKVEAMGGTVKQVEERHDAAFYQEQAQLLVKDHADYADVAATDAFQQWKDGLRPELKAIYDRNEAAIVNAGEVSDLLNLFKARPGQKAAPTSQTGQQSDPNPVNDRRASQLAGQPRGASTGGSATSGIPADDYDASWDAFAKQDERRRSQLR